jgi:hypothetical protein
VPAQWNDAHRAPNPNQPGAFGTYGLAARRWVREHASVLSRLWLPTIRRVPGLVGRGEHGPTDDQGHSESRCRSPVQLARERPSDRPLSARALAVLAPWPAAGPALAFLQLLLGPPNAAFSGHLLLGILDPADELVAGQRRDVLPRIECRGVGDQRLAQVSWKLVHHPTGHLRAAHRATVAGQAGPFTLPANRIARAQTIACKGSEHRPIDPTTGTETAAAGQLQVSVDAATAALDPIRWTFLVAEDRPRTMAGTGVDAIISARRRR